MLNVVIWALLKYLLALKSLLLIMKVIDEKQWLEK